MKLHDFSAVCEIVLAQIMMVLAVLQLRNILVSTFQGLVQFSSVILCVIRGTLLKRFEKYVKLNVVGRCSDLWWVMRLVMMCGLFSLVPAHLGCLKTRAIKLGKMHSCLLCVIMCNAMDSSLTNVIEVGNV